MARCLNGYKLRLAHYKASYLDHFFPFLCFSLLSHNLLSTVKFFADDRLFSVVNDSKISVNEPNKDLLKRVHK